MLDLWWEVGDSLGRAMARHVDRDLARMSLGIQGWKTYIRSRRLFAVNSNGERLVYDDKALEWRPR